MQLRHQHNYTKSQGKPFSSVSSQRQKGCSDPHAVQGTGLCLMLEDSDTVSHLCFKKVFIEKCRVVVDIRVDSRNIVFTGLRLIFYQQKEIVH